MLPSSSDRKKFYFLRYEYFDLGFLIFMKIKVLK